MPFWEAHGHPEGTGHEKLNIWHMSTNRPSFPEKKGEKRAEHIGSECDKYALQRGEYARFIEVQVNTGKAVFTESALFSRDAIGMRHPQAARYAVTAHNSLHS
jgi:hypothetical protein